MEIDPIAHNDIRNKPSMSVLKDLIPYLKKVKGILIATMLYLLISTLTSTVVPLLLKTAIDDYIIPKDFHGLLFIGLYSLLLIIGTYIFQYFGTYYSFVAAQKIVLDLRKDIFHKLLTLSNRYLGKTPLGVIITRTTNDTEKLSELMSSGAVQLINDAILLIVTLFFLFSTNVTLSLYSLCLTPLVVWSIVVFSKLLRASYDLARGKLTQLNINLQENLSGISIIKIFNRQKKNRTYFDAISEGYGDATYRALKQHTYFNQTINICSFLSRITVVVAGSYMVIKGTSTIGTLTAFLFWVNYFYQPLRDMGERFNILQDAASSMGKIGDILHCNDTIPDNALPSPTPPIFKGKIEFKNVVFRYSEEKDILKNVSFTIEPSQRIALVGPTGAGKSTIMNILLRLFDIESGAVYIDGKELRSLPLQELRSNMSIVLQDVFIFKGSVRDNISLGQNIPIEQIIEASRFLNAHTFITTLPKGYDTMLSSEGSNLSHGQKQLISFIRALVHNPRILLLDEATSSVDTYTEKLIQEGINKLMQGRTSIAIAHRLSTITSCDKIFVIDQGKIIEQGNHEELLTKKGFYYDLYTTQFQDSL
ncbi:MAG: ABC transporter ATP-binding protein [Caldisericia bacterium]|nr:ABC transporter ATP-binding protein [Caldisericia bacterium]MDD4613888.1 ABC transporter ATP-binding protein [Caldisericia bacterium]